MTLLEAFAQSKVHAAQLRGVQELPDSDAVQLRGGLRCIDQLFVLTETAPGELREAEARIDLLRAELSQPRAADPLLQPPPEPYASPAFTPRQDHRSLQQALADANAHIAILEAEAEVLTEKVIEGERLKNESSYLQDKNIQLRAQRVKLSEGKAAADKRVKELEIQLKHLQGDAATPSSDGEELLQLWAALQQARQQVREADSLSVDSVGGGGLEQVVVGDGTAASPTCSIPPVPAELNNQSPSQHLQILIESHRELCHKLRRAYSSMKQLNQSAATDQVRIGKFGVALQHAKVRITDLEQQLAASNQSEVALIQLASPLLETGSAVGEPAGAANEALDKQQAGSNMSPEDRRNNFNSRMQKAAIASELANRKKRLPSPTRKVSPTRKDPLTDALFNRCSDLADSILGDSV